MKPTVIADGVDGLFIQNNRFNTTLVSFNFYLPLAEKDVSVNALLPYVLTSCSQKYKTFTELNLALNMLYGAGLSVSVSKIGDAQLIKIAISVINDEYSIDNEQVIQKATDLLMNLIFEPKVDGEAFCETDVEREKRKAREHILGEINDKRLYARKRLIAEMFKGSEYAVSAYGTTELLDKVDGTALFNAWQNMLSTAYVRVQLVGKTLPDNFFAAITDKFSKYNRKVNNGYKNLTELKPRTEINNVTERLDVAQGKLVMGFSSDVWGTDAYALTVATDIFGGGTYSGLFSNVREKLSLCYYCSASANKNKGYVMVDSGVEFKNAACAKEEILNQLKLVQNGEFEDNVFAASKKNILNSLNSSYDSLGALDNWYCANIYCDDIKAPEEVGKIITDLTLEEIISAAKGIKLNTVFMLLGKEGE